MPEAILEDEVQHHHGSNESHWALSEHAPKEICELAESVHVRPNVRAKLPAEAGAVSLVRDDAPCAADQAYSACRSGSA